jgi:hypothetical protein
VEHLLPTLARLTLTQQPGDLHLAPVKQDNGTSAAHPRQQQQIIFFDQKFQFTYP